MNQSEQINDLMEALAAAQGEFNTVPKSKTAKVRGQSRAGKDYEYSYKYADISDVLAAVIPALSKHGIALLQPTIIDNGIMSVRTILNHKGQWISSDYPVCPVAGDHQSMGGALTYARRYGLCTLVGVAAEEDVDGQGAAEPEARRQAPKPPVQQTEIVGQQPSAQWFGEFAALVRTKLASVSADKLKEANESTLAKMRDRGCSLDQFEVMSDIFRKREIELLETSKVKKKAPPPNGKVQTISVDFEKIRKEFIEEADKFEDYEDILKLYETKIEPIYTDLIPPEMAEFDGLMRQYEKRLAP